MIYLVKGETNQIVLTLTEKQTLTNPNYLFRFIHRALNVEVKFVLLNAADTSLFKDRYNQFSIVTNTYFTNYNTGEWEYYIYEQISTTNTNPSLTTTMLESGIMRLDNSTNFEYDTYQTSNTFITR